MTTIAELSQIPYDKLTPKQIISVQTIFSELPLHYIYTFRPHVSQFRFLDLHQFFKSDTEQIKETLVETYPHIFKQKDGLTWLGENYYYPQVLQSYYYPQTIKHVTPYTLFETIQHYHFKAFSYGYDHKVKYVLLEDLFLHMNEVDQLRTWVNVIYQLTLEHDGLGMDFGEFIQRMYNNNTDATLIRIAKRMNEYLSTNQYRYTDTIVMEFLRQQSGIKLAYSKQWLDYFKIEDKPSYLMSEGS